MCRNTTRPHAATNGAHAMGTAWSVCQSPLSTFCGVSRCLKNLVLAGRLLPCSAPCSRSHQTLLGVKRRAHAAPVPAHQWRAGVASQKVLASGCPNDREQGAVAEVVAVRPVAPDAQVQCVQRRLCCLHDRSPGVVGQQVRVMLQLSHCGGHSAIQQAQELTMHRVARVPAYC
jgi:hypothetical protein